MKNHICDGVTIEHAPSANIVSGEGLLIGSIFGVATADIPATQKGVFMTYGVFKMPKASVVITQGAKLYWDAINKKVTTVATDNTEIGYAQESAVSGDETVAIKIG